MILKTTVDSLKTAHLLRITLAFEPSTALVSSYKNHLVKLLVLNSLLTASDIAWYSAKVIWFPLRDPYR